MTTENTEIDEQNLPYNISVNSELINMVSANLKYDLNIAPVRVNWFQTTPESLTSSGYRYDIPMNGSSAYINRPIEEVRIKVKITSHTFKEDNSKINGKNGSTTVANMITDYGVIGTPPVKYLPGVMGFKPLPIQSLKDTITYSTGSFVSTSKFCPFTIDTYLRSLSDDELRYFNQMSPCVPDKTDKYESLATGTPYMYESLTTVNDNETQCIILKNQYNRMDHLSMNPDNVLSPNARYVKPDAVEFKTSAGVDLTSRMENGISIPVNGANDYYSGAGESLIEEYEFTFYEFLFHPMFNGYRSDIKALLISHLNKMTFDTQLHHNLSRIISCSYPQTGYNFKEGGGTRCPTPQLSDTKIEVSLLETKLWFMAVEMPTEITPSPIIRIPYISSDLYTQHFGNDGRKWDQSRTFNTTTITLSKIPLSMMVWIETYDLDLQDHMYNRGLSTAPIKNISIKLGQVDNICRSYSQLKLYEISKRNGLIQYSFDDVKGKNVFSSYNVQEEATVSANGVLSQNGTANVFLLNNRMRHIQGAGSRLLLKFGQDIDLNDSLLAPSLGNEKINFSFRVETDAITENQETFARVAYSLHYDEEMTISENKANQREPVVDRGDVIRSYKIINQRHDFPKKASIFTGAGLFGSMSKHIKNYMPKLLSKKTLDNIKSTASDLRGNLENSSNPHLQSGASTLKKLGFGYK